MRNIVLVLVAAAILIAILVVTGFLNLSPEGEEQLDNARENVGEAVEDAGQAIEGAGDEVQDGQ